MLCSHLGQLSTGLRRRPLTLGERSDGRQWPGSGLASADGPCLDGCGEPFEEPLQRLPGRATGCSNLDGLQDNAPATGSRPAVQSRDVSFPAPPASGEFIGRLGKGNDGL